MIGKILDERYKIVRRLGEGGMGEVFLAEHINLGRQDALKLLREDLAHDPEFVARFRREARAANRLQHPNIVVVHDFGRLSSGRFYLSMELVTGQRLDHIIRGSGPMAMPRALRVLSQLADAVDHAHSRSVVHRDLKPENMVLIEHRGRKDILKILDFGIAKIVKGDVQESVTVSHKGKVWGTPAYMAPEQFSGGVADPRCDIYAIGCIAYDLLVGEPPFTGHMLQLLEKHMSSTPERPSARRPAARIPPELDEIVLRCLAKKASERYQSGRDLYLALSRLLEDEQRSPSGRRSSYSIGVSEPSDTVGATEWSSARGPTVGRTEPLSTAVAARAVQEVVRTLAQALADLEGIDARMLLALTAIRQLDDDLIHNEAQQAALEAFSDDLEAASRAREASLRFAQGELHFQRSAALGRGMTPDEALDHELRALEVRVAELPERLERELQPVTDQSITLAGVRHELEERRGALYAELEAAVDDAQPRHEQKPTIAPLAARLRAIRGAIPRR